MKTLTFILILVHCSALSQSIEWLPAIASRSIPITPYSRVMNPAFLTRENASYINLECQNRYGLKELSGSLFTFSKKGEKLGRAISLGHFGSSLYQKSSVASSVGLSINDKISVGAGLGYSLLRLSELILVEQKFSAILGSAYQFNSKTIFSSLFHYQNKQSYASIGVQHKFSESFIGFIEATANSGIKQITVAARYQVIKQLQLFYGIRSGPFMNCFGTAFLRKQLEISLSFQSQQTLGNNSCLAVSWKFGEK